MADTTRRWTGAHAIHSRETQSPTTSSKVSLLPHRSRGLRRGLSLDTLPHTDPGDPALAEGEGEPSLKQIMEAIFTCQTTLTAHIEGMRAEMSYIKQDVENFREKATEAENRISDLEDVVRPLESTAQTMQIKITAHTDKLGDMEDRQRRNNVRFVGFPEKAEGKQPEDFLELWLQDNMTDTTFSRLFPIELAHI